MFASHLNPSIFISCIQIHFSGLCDDLKFFKRIQEVIFLQLLHLYDIGCMSSINHANEWFQREGSFPHLTLFKQTVIQLVSSVNYANRWLTGDGVFPNFALCYVV